jgi:hypothetical protein
VVVANVSALAIPDTEENWQASLNVDLMHTVPTRAGRHASSRAQRGRVDHRHLQRAPDASRTSLRPVRHREDRHHRLHQRAWHCSWRAGHPREHRRRPATPTSRVGSGQHRDRGPRPVQDSDGAHPSGHMGTPEEVAAPVVFLAAPWPAGSVAQTSWWTAP